MLRIASSVFAMPQSLQQPTVSKNIRPPKTQHQSSSTYHQRGSSPTGTFRQRSTFSAPGPRSQPGRRTPKRSHQHDSGSGQKRQVTHGDASQVRQDRESTLKPSYDIRKRIESSEKSEPLEAQKLILCGEGPCLRLSWKPKSATQTSSPSRPVTPWPAICSTSLTDTKRKYLRPLNSKRPSDG